MPRPGNGKDLLWRSTDLIHLTAHLTGDKTIRLTVNKDQGDATVSDRIHRRRLLQIKATEEPPAKANKMVQHHRQSSVAEHLPNDLTW